MPSSDQRPGPSLGLGPTAIACAANRPRFRPAAQAEQRRPPPPPPVADLRRRSASSPASLALAASLLALTVIRLSSEIRAEASPAAQLGAPDLHAKAELRPVIGERPPAGRSSNRRPARQSADPERRDHFNETPDEEAAADGEPNALPAAGSRPADDPAPDSAHEPPEARPKLRVVRLFAPEAVQNATQDVTIDCMFKFEPKLDQRLAIKWFFEDQLEPIYQWIPELNKRVYSDSFERFLDKSYQVTDDVDFMLHAHKAQLARQLGPHSAAAAAAAAAEPAPPDDEQRLAANRKLLANRLNRLDKLGSEHSKQLIQSLRKSLLMERLEFSRFRALRLLRPSTQLNGRFTCSVSSLDGEDLQSTRLVVYEPARSFTFNVSRASQGQQAYNLSCQAGPMFPRPSLALYRYRAAPLDLGEGSAGEARAPAGAAGRAHAPARPRLAATSLRLELLSGVQSRLTVSARSPAPAREPRELSIDQWAAGSPDEPDPGARDFVAGGPTLSGGGSDATDATQAAPAGSGAFEVAAWALVDEASLSNGNLASQFECVLTIDGANYEQRQTLSLQKGWHVHSAALSARSTLVGLFSALASLLCLIVALASALLIFKLLRRHANQRKVHQAKTAPRLHFGPTKRRGGGGGGSKSAAQEAPPAPHSAASSESPATSSSTGNGAPPGADHHESDEPDGHSPGPQQSARLVFNSAGGDPPASSASNRQRFSERLVEGQAREEFALAPSAAALASGPPVGHYNVPTTAHIAGQQMVTHQGNAPADAIYRIPESSTFGARFLVGPVAAAAAAQLPPGASAAHQQRLQWQQYYASQQLERELPRRALLPEGQRLVANEPATRQRQPGKAGHMAQQQAAGQQYPAEYANGRPLYC